MGPVPAELVARASTAYDAVSMAGGAVWWVEGRPDGTDALVRWRPGGGARVVAAPVGSLVHGYGGGAYLAGERGVWFCHRDDQRVWYRPARGPARPVTPEAHPPGSVRYADLRLVPGAGRLVAVRERELPGGQVVNELVSLPADEPGGPVRVLAAGWDFYATPRPSPDGRRLAWTCWNAPLMPWDGAWLYVADLDATAGRLGPAVHVAGGPDESVVQPAWGPDGTLSFVSDRTGWWNLHAWQHGQARPVLVQEAEHAAAPWEFGYATYAFCTRGRVAIVAQHGPRQWLQLLGPDGTVTRLELPFTAIKPYLAADGTRLAVIAATPATTPMVVLLDLEAGTTRTLAAAPPPPDPGTLSTPEPFTFPTRDGARGHGLYYPPHPARDPAGHGGPPLVVKAHPGPTANASLRLDWHTQYLTSRGYAVAWVDYRGSTGYGRAWRQALAGWWGVRDALDCADAAAALAAAGRADPRRMAVWGASAGGYTALRALALTRTFAAAVAYAPVVDPATWRQAAPKFQAHHAHTLIGPWPQAADRYQQRSVLAAAARIDRPVLLLHGEADPITPAAHTRALARALGTHAELRTFPGEGHTLRTPTAIRTALTTEQAFLRKALPP